MRPVPVSAARETRPPPEETIDKSRPSDPSAQNLYDISGALLLYYAINREMPPTLSDLQTVTDPGSLHLNDPKSHLPYFYVPDGLAREGENKRIIVCDPTPSDDGKRWCILMPHVAPNAAQSTEVSELPERIFRLYRSVTP
jgi:hypothetical protein